jgi:LuxR family maltose regulon positive regulatory protein
VTTRKDSFGLLSKLESSNLFVVPLDDRREWYRYHHLFRDTLNYRLVEQIGKQFVQELHRRAARWYSQHDFLDEALQHWMKAGEHAEAANLIEVEGHQMLARGQLSKLRRWIDALPAELVRARPWLSIQYAWILNLMGQLEDMELRLRDAERALPQEDLDLAKAIKGNIATVRAGAARKQNNSQAAIGYLQEALENLSKDDVLVRSSAHFNLGCTFLDMGDVSKGEQELHAALREAERADNVYTLIASRSYLADSYLLQGQLRRAARTYEQVIEEGLARNNGKPLPMTGYAHSGLGQVLYEQNLLDKAESHLSLALELSEHLRDWTIVRRSLPTLARLQLATGLTEQAEASWEKALDLAGQYDDQLGVNYLEAYRARMWLEQSARKSDPVAFASAGRWAEAYRAAPHDVKDYRETFAQLTLAWIEVVQGDLKQALSRLEQLAEVAQTDGRIDCLIKTLACSALAQGMLGQIDAAQSTLRQAIELAAPEGYCRTFVNFGPYMRDLLQGVVASEPVLQYVRSLLTVFSFEAQAASSKSLAENLTNRELEVLKLLAAGFSNQEIADELVITLGTVKQYNHIIFRKLEVRTRMDAAKRARELRLL